MNLSFEFFPPKTAEGLEKLTQTAKTLGQLSPNYFSVTFGAGGSTREHTPNTVRTIHQATQINTAPHISCVNATKAELTDLLTQYQQSDIKRLVVLRGDKPSGAVSAGEFRHANQLVEFIRQQTDDHFHISVAAYPETHPESKNMATELKHFKEKVNCGANQAITQYFYNAEAYFYFVEQCQKMDIDIPIVPGIMPITNYERLSRFSTLCGAEIPLWIRKQCEAYGEDLTSVKQFGFEVVAKLCHTLLDGGAPGLHFYTLNQTDASLKLVNTVIGDKTCCMT